MLNTNHNLRVADLPNNRAKKLAWMRESYSWHIIFTDRMSCINPKFGPMGVMFQFMQTNFGNCLNAQGPQGPPTGATTHA